MKQKPKQNIDHIRWSWGGRFLCKNCGDKYEMRLPASIDVVLGSMKGYTKVHRTCRKKILVEKRLV